jgi:hypothetical protein
MQSTSTPLNSFAQFEALRERLDAVTLSPHRRAYAYHLLNTGMAASQASQSRLSEYCLARLKIELDDKESRAAKVANPLSPWARWDAYFIQTGLQKTRDLVEPIKASWKLPPRVRRASGPYVEPFPCAYCVPD